MYNHVSLHTCLVLVWFLKDDVAVSCVPSRQGVYYRFPDRQHVVPPFRCRQLYQCVLDLTCSLAGNKLRITLLAVAAQSGFVMQTCERR